MMRTSVVVVVLAGIMVLRSNIEAWGGGGYEFFGLGLRAMGMGGAFIGKADDPSANYWNPAGLAQLRGKGFHVDFYNDIIHYTDNNSIRNVNPQDVSLFRNDVFIRRLDSEPYRFHKDPVNILYVVLNGSGYFQWRDYTFGISTYVPNGNYIDWKDTIPDDAGGIIRADFLNQFFLSVLNLSVARQLTPRLYLGGGVNLVYGQFKLDTDKHYVGNPWYKFGLDANATGTGIEGILGALYKITDRLRIGGVYRTGATMDVEGHASILQTPVSGSTDGFYEASDYDQKFPLPETWGIGIAYDILPNLSLVWDWQMTDWTVMETDINYDYPGLALRNINKKLDWEINTRMRMGAEYTVNETFSLRFGYWYEQGAIHDKGNTYTAMTQMDLHFITLGATYYWERWGINLFASPHWGHERVGGRPIKDQDFMAGVGFTFRF